MARRGTPVVGMSNRFAIDGWAAWAPGLADQSAWQRWLAQPTSITASGKPLLEEMPAMMRRRVEQLGRAALQAAYWCQGSEGGEPVIFASRYGDIRRSVDMLQSLARQESLSPTSFSLSVHNAIGALYSIAREDTGNYIALAAGAATVPMAFIEAQGLLADGAPSVLLVVYDEPLPPVYLKYATHQEFPRAWACRIARASAHGVSLHRADVPAPSATELPPDLAILHFLTSEQAALQQGDWVWSRHA